MRVVLALSALLLAGAAAPPSAIIPAPAPEPGGLGASPPSAAVCSDRIDLVRAERGLPKLDRGTASPDEPLLIAAVDHRIGGCSVMVMKNDTSDVRPLPAPREGPPRLERIPGQ